MPSSEFDFDKLFRENFSRIYQYFRRNGESHEEARDLAQETFTRVYEKRETFRGETSLEKWAMVVAKSILLNKIRFGKAAKRKGNQAPLEDETLPDHHWSSVLDGMITREDRNRLFNAIVMLSRRERRVVELRLSGHSFSEVATMMSSTENTVKSQYSKATKKLRSMFGITQHNPGGG